MGSSNSSVEIYAYIPLQMEQVRYCENHANENHINERSICRKKPQLTRRVIGNCKQWNRFVAGEFRGVSCVTSLHQSVAHLRERGKSCREESRIKRPHRFLVATIILVHICEGKEKNLKTEKKFFKFERNKSHDYLGGFLFK